MYFVVLRCLNDIWSDCLYCGDGIRGCGLYSGWNFGRGLSYDIWECDGNRGGCGLGFVCGGYLILNNGGVLVNSERCFEG